MCSLKKYFRINFCRWEWTQIGTTKENHWGHRNVIFKDIQNLPARPIGARTPDSGLGVFDTTEQAVSARWLDVFNFKRYSDLKWLLNEVRKIPFCEEGIASPDLPLDCYEYIYIQDCAFRNFLLYTSIIVQCHI